MSFSNKDFYLTNPRPEHFEKIQALCKKVYPFIEPWSKTQLESHLAYFPGGQLIVLNRKTDQLVGMAFSLIVAWDDYSPQDNWGDFTDGGYFRNHNPVKGKTLYGAEVMVDPEFQGMGIGGLLYKGRREILSKYNLKRIRAGARLIGYSKYKNKLTAYEYVKKVVEKEIYDPTLSFQLKKGFVVLDVAKNYIYNDPESMGYAAVIEYLNPENATDKDLKKQKKSVDYFLQNPKFIPENLPKDLRKMVRRATYLLGQIIKEQEGEEFFNKIESYRQGFKKFRKDKNISELDKKYIKLTKEDEQKKYLIAHAFSLQLEIVNACENAYRSIYQRKKTFLQTTNHKTDLTFVLTAHPTEARSQKVISIVTEIVQILIEGGQNNFIYNEEKILTLFRILWQLPLSKVETPNVLDEAEYINSIIFNKKIFEYLLKDNDGHTIRINTWVGGDKDGHPGVDKHVMKSCFNISRKNIIEILIENLNQIICDLSLIKSSKKNEKDLSTLGLLVKQIKTFESIKSKDGDRVRKWIIGFELFSRNASPFILKHFNFKQIKNLISLFPGFVIPIELREDSQIVENSLTDKKLAIREMLIELKDISGSYYINNYARALILSHCESAKDISNGIKLVRKTLGDKVIRVVPLFETKSSLENAKDILTKHFSNSDYRNKCLSKFNSTFEVMLGYSDSAKEIGMLGSRNLIREAMYSVEKVLKNYKIKPIFFHGSGGSVARGGGSLKEQLAWWSNSAISSPKVTIQGEMVQRMFATKEILHSQCTHLSKESLFRKSKKIKHIKSEVLDEIVKTSEEMYKNLINDRELLMRLLNVTPYKFLKNLKLGSRPSKRIDRFEGVQSLRAIPWVLCWTQAHLLLPAWYGIGSAWSKLDLAKKEQLNILYANDPFFSSYVKSLGFTLAKVDFDIFRLYFRQIDTDKKTQEEILSKLESEYKNACKFVTNISQNSNLLYFRPWLDESIKLRSPNIFILNLLQIDALKNNSHNLLRETIVGIASGMLTTG